VRTLNCDSPAVVIEPSFWGDKLAVGHQNGSVSIYDLEDLSDEASPEPNVTFEGHTSKRLVFDFVDFEEIRPLIMSCFPAASDLKYYPATAVWIWIVS